MSKKVIVELWPRTKLLSTVAGKTYFPRDRQRISKLLGQADEVHFHARVYARDASVSVDIAVFHGCLGDDNPADGLRQFSLTNSGQSPTMPWSSANMSTLPDDGTFYVTPKMGLVDVMLKADGANGFIEIEVWATAIFQS